MIANCPSNIVEQVSFGATGDTVTWIEPTATDDSGVAPMLVTRTHAPGSFFTANQVTTVSYIFRDGAGNEAACVFTVFVNEGMIDFSLFNMFIEKRPTKIL